MDQSICASLSHTHYWYGSGHVESGSCPLVACPIPPHQRRASYYVLHQQTITTYWPGVTCARRINIFFSVTLKTYRVAHSVKEKWGPAEDHHPSRPTSYPRT